VPSAHHGAGAWTRIRSGDEQGARRWQRAAWT
jgi:hypothetical protein